MLTGTQLVIVNRLNVFKRKNIALAEARFVVDTIALVRTELAKWANVIKIAGIKPD